MVHHVDKFGRSFWIIAFVVAHEEMLAVRSFLGMGYDKDYNPHISTLEKPV